LPKKKCKECGEPTYLAFAVKLVGQEIDIMKYLPFFAKEYQEKQTVLLEILNAVGYNAPPSVLNEER
jgi:ArsR family metal-binding transcriptional regulator